MENKRMSFNVLCVTIMMIGLFSGECKADWKKFRNCMTECVVTCVIPPWTPICPASCVAKCLVHQIEPPLSVSSSPARFCTVGCATSLCSKIITRDDPHLDEVESCVKQCSGSCNKNYATSVH